MGTTAMMSNLRSRPRDFNEILKYYARENYVSRDRPYVFELSFRTSERTSAVAVAEKEEREREREREREESATRGVTAES